MKRCLWLIVAAVVSVPVYAATQTARPEDVGLSSDRLKRVTELMQRLIDQQAFPGAVTLVARHGRIAHFEAQGLMDLESRKPMQRDGIFRIMSMTKPVVSVAIMMLVEEGKVRLTDPVSKFIPELKGLKVTVPNVAGAVAPAPSGAGGAPLPSIVVEAERDITIRDLLTHTAGFVTRGGTSQLSVGPGESLAQVLSRARAVTLDFQPGTRWAYSPQYGFDALVRVVEVASGSTFDRFAKARVFDPLSMKDTYFYPADGNPRLATLYQVVDGRLQKRANEAFMNGTYLSGGGGLFSTAEDYLQFALMLLNRGQHAGKRLLSVPSVDLMTSVFAPDTLPGRTAGEGFGLSLRVVTDPAARTTLLSKGSFGWSGAFNTHFFIDRARDTVGIFMTQSAFLESRGQIRDDFEAAVMQAIVGD